MVRTKTPEQVNQARQLADDIRNQSAEILQEVADLLAAIPDEELFGDNEFVIRNKVLQIVATAYQARLGQKKNGYDGSSINCPHCGQTASFHGYRERSPLSLGGMVKCYRAYYYCRSCGHGSYPWDKNVGLTDQNLTPAVERLATLTGAIADSFEKGGELLEETAGICLSESTIQRTTEATGQRIVEAFAHEGTLGPSHPWKWYLDAYDRSIAYIGLDATGVRQQGKHGEKVDGRMAQVGMIFNPLPDPQRVFAGLPKRGARMQARYVSGLYPLAEMGPLLRRQAAHVGMDEAEIWIALTDGGAGLEDFMARNFPRVSAVILDFWHAAEYLAKLAKVLHAHDEEKAKEQTEQWSRTLKEEGGTVMIAVLAEWDWPERVAGLKATREEVLTYFRNQEERMDYPTYEANGWYIGSGAVESACKTVVGQRMKGAGMRWRERGAHEVCHVRALYRSESSQWQSFWRREFSPGIQTSTN